MIKQSILLVLFCCSFMAQGAGKLIQYDVDSSLYEGYWIKAKQGAPLILLVHDWDGLTEYEKKRSDMLAAMGYNVFAADLFGVGVRPTKVEDKRQHTGELYKDREKMRKLMNEALNTAYLLNGTNTDVVVMGYCFGGAAVLEMARSGVDAKGFVTFHGGLKTPDNQSYAQTKGKILVFHGSADTAIPMSQFSDLATELESNKIDHEMVTYSGAPHAFTVFGSKRYYEKADKQSWARFTSFLSEATASP